MSHLGPVVAFRLRTSIATCAPLPEAETRRSEPHLEDGPDGGRLVRLGEQPGLVAHPALHGDAVLTVHTPLHLDEGCEVPRIDEPYIARWFSTGTELVRYLQQDLAPEAVPE